MRSARRLASVAVVASLAVAGLSACRSAPSVAAYLGDTTITESRVTDVYNEVYDAVSATPPPKGEAVPMPITRMDVARVLVSAEILPIVAKQHNVSLPATVPVDDYASALSIPPGTEYAKLFAESDTLTTLLRQNATTQPQLTDTDLREVYDALVTSGQIPANTPFDQFKSALPADNTQAVQSAVAVRNEIAEVTSAMTISINPRYQPMAIPVLLFQTQQKEVRALVSAPIGANDASVPVSAAPGAAAAS
ncbi:hypothetical protein [Paractinoplanes globisporus]|jgi:hypothetical protein|uniref:Lipoprotein n=1 Tax=Paractinoplanes globisporus TaxID=113565 RepID=A0ABW6WHE7_9ACTN|nr:hypothetical protein [Actinoplanes globisporus]